jgi:hypothetical protein
MADTFIKISSVSVGSGGTSTLNFPSIPGTYTDLKLILSLRKVDATTISSSYMKFNGSSTGYSYKRFFGTGTSYSQDTNVVGTTSMYIGSSNSATSTSDSFSAVEIYIPNYISTTDKGVLCRMGYQDNTSGYEFAIIGKHTSTSAITSIDITGDGNYAQYTTGTLYGILKY